MSTIQQSELCRISVWGPGGRADLAVPMSIPVANLLPVLLRHTGGPAAAEGMWVLQRLGEPPLDAAGTPESLDWREGDEFHLRPHETPLPELDFDDVADGMATAVSRRPGRWKPEFNRWLFLGLSIVALVTLARTVLYLGNGVSSTAGAGLVSVSLLVAAASSAARVDDRALLLLLGLGGCGFAFLAGMLGGAGESEVDFDALPVLVGCFAMAVAGGILLAVRAAWGRRLPFEPLGAVVAVGVFGAVPLWCHLFLAMTAVQAAGLVSAALIVVLVFAPRVGIRFARIRGPQLPRTADELQYDIEAMPADRMVRLTGYADGYLTIISVAAAVVLAGSSPFLAMTGGFGVTLGALVMAAVLLRSRALNSGWQRVPLAGAGVVVAMELVVGLDDWLEPRLRAFVVVGVAVLFFLLVLAMLRPPPRRLLPIWGHLANWAETLSAVAVIPVLLQLFGIYGWAAGLAG